VPVPLSGPLSPIQAASPRSRRTLRTLGISARLRPDWLGRLRRQPAGRRVGL